MSWATTPETFAPRGSDQVLMVGDEETRAELVRARRQGFLPVELPILGPATRGHLALAIENAVEQALEAMGGTPSVATSSDLDACLSDQLYRARTVGATGLAISLGSLDGLANLAGALDAEDSAVLRWWLGETAERPVRLLLRDSDRYLGIYGPPVPLQTLLHAPGGDARAGTVESLSAPEPRPEPVIDSSSERNAESPEIVAVERPGPTKRDVDQDLCQLAEVMASFFKSTSATPEPSAVGSVDAAPNSPSPPDTGGAAPVTETAPPVEARRPEPAAEGEPASSVPAGPVALLNADAGQKWPSWTAELDAARGPKALGTVERMFVTAYVPLMEAVAAGLAGAEAREVAQRWAASFEKSYVDAFDSLSLRNRRPTMVLDVPDLGMRLGRLHGARAVQLFLVDGMRFDLGLRIHEYLKPLLLQRAVLTERYLLWAALPAKTSVQLELIARGPEGMRRTGSAPETELPVARGRAAATPRRVKVGLRELFKLDLVEARLSDSGPPVLERLDALARETAEAIAKHCLRLPQRTLLMLFGDHGFGLDAQPAGTARARQGGASPEEVLVPAFAWLVGDFH